MDRELNTDSKNAGSNDTASYDVVIIGAGINGAACALDAASRGYSTLLIDKNDYGSKTSAGCFKIIHGGLRYLQHLDFARVFESLKEQKLIRKNASHLVRPIPFLIPTYKKFSKSKFFLGSGLFLYDLLNIFRNKNIANAEKLPGFKFLNVEQTLAIAPHITKKLNGSNLTGSVVYYDCQITNCERLTWTVVKTAKEYGAKCLNYAELVSSEVENGLIKSLEVKDLVANKRLKVKPKAVILAAGPWNSKLRKVFGLKQKKEIYSKGVQFALPKLVNEYALAVDSNFKDPDALISTGARKFFIQPWNGLSLVGTSDSIYEGKPDDFEITEQETEDFLNEVKLAYPDQNFKKENIKFVFGGLRPMSDTASLKEGDSKTSRKAKIESNFGSELKNLVIVTGIKYTTFRLVAEKVCDMISGILNNNFKIERKKSITEDIVLVGADKSKTEVLSEIGVDNQELFHCFGSESSSVLEAVLEKGRNLDTAQIEFSKEQEDVVKIEDALYRRTNLALLKKEFKS